MELEESMSKDTASESIDAKSNAEVTLAGIKAQIGTGVNVNTLATIAVKGTPFLRQQF
jgi:hypothetical protein